MKLDWLKTTRGRVIVVAAGAAAALLIGGGVAYAVDGGVGHTGTPPHPATIAVDAQGYEHVCVNQFPPYEVMRGNLTDTCLAGYLPSKVATGQVAQGPQGPIGLTGPRGFSGPTGPAGKDGKDGVDAQPVQYGVALVNVSRGGAAATNWETLSTTLGSPVGDTTSGTFRLSCSAAQAPCVVSVQAYSTDGSRKVYPRLDILSQDFNAGGPETSCEYADGVDNDGGSQALTTTAATVPLGVGGTLDCNEAQTLPASGVVTSLALPTGRYDLMTTFIFNN